ncbi:MAG: TauD/TfdA family dioxygenase [Verrucomicrobia bacterium]|nr:TauD/TfdA family dioxygenase [Verrucomicrobiota bacterium]
MCDALRPQPRPVQEVRWSDAQRESLRADLAPARAALEDGRGFVILTFPVERFPKAEWPLVYWLTGQLLGEPFEQNVQGTVLYDVTDKGQDLTKGARFSVTNYESSFHTDNSFGGDVLDYVGLLCLEVAKAGGVSQMMSGYAVHDELARHHPAELALLCQPFHVDRRGGLRPGETPTAHFPVMQWDGGELLLRYLRFWIQAGHEKVGQPLTPAQAKALDTLDEVLKQRDLMAEFSVKPGDIFFINNRWLLHNRTAFEDWPELERRRHLVRLWIKK